MYVTWGNQHDYRIGQRITLTEPHWLYGVTELTIYSHTIHGLFLHCHTDDGQETIVHLFQIK